MNNALTQSAVAGGIATVFGAAAAYYLLASDKQEGYVFYCLLIALASFVILTALWWIFVARTNPPSVWRGALAGGLGVIFINYALFYSIVVKEYVTYHVAATPLTDIPPPNLLVGVLIAGVTTIMSCLTIAWMVPTGVLAGTLYAWALRALASS